jgi:serine/threonine-protein kinase RsbW
MMIAAHTTWTIPPRTEELGPLRASVADVASQLGAPAGLKDDIALATSEAAANAMVHAYRRRPPDDVLTTVGLADEPSERILVVVADAGDGFEPRAESAGVGLGLPLIATLSDQLEVNERAPSGTELVMHFLLDDR